MMKFRMTLTCLEARVLGAALFVTVNGPRPTPHRALSKEELDSLEQLSSKLHDLLADAWERAGTEAAPDRRSTIRARLATRIALPVPSQITTLLERILASSAEDHDAMVVTGLGEYGGRPSAFLELRDRILQQADL